MLEELIDGLFQLEDVRQAHIFPYIVEKYIRYEYELLPWFKAIPQKMFEALERRSGLRPGRSKGQQMISVVLYGRNDSYGYNLHKRAALSLNCMAEVLTEPMDEILFVDYNTPDDYPVDSDAKCNANKCSGSPGKGRIFLSTSPLCRIPEMRMRLSGGEEKIDTVKAKTELFDANRPA